MRNNIVYRYIYYKDWFTFTPHTMGEFLATRKLILSTFHTLYVIDFYSIWLGAQRTVYVYIV